MRKCFILVISAILLSGCMDLPKCNDKETRNLLNEIISSAIEENNESYKYIDAKNVKEIGFNKEKEIRVCQADILYSDGDEENITYNIYWDEKKGSMFYVEIVN